MDSNVIHTRYTLGSVLVPTGTAVAAPITQDLTVEAGVLVRVEVMIPDGHDGLTGIRLSYSGVQILPWAGAWLIANAETIPFAVGLYIGGGQPIVAEAYNIGDYDHTFYLRFEVADAGAAEAGPSPVTIEPVSAGVTVGSSPASTGSLVGYA